jgi:hypothetical protein
MKLYRYERAIRLGEYSEYKVDLVELEIIKETPKGYWVKYYNGVKDKKFILKGNNGKRFAYETKEVALSAFKIRTKRSIGFCEQHLKDAKSYLSAANKIEL